MSNLFTRVEIAFFPERLNHWLRFGLPDEQIDLDRRRSIALFRPGFLFGYVRWRANEYGTQDWRFVVVATKATTRALSCIEGVYPGGEVLLFVTGSARVKRALSQVDALEADGFEPSAVSHLHYRQVHNRIVVGMAFPVYAEVQHAAYLAAQRVAS